MNDFDPWNGDGSTDITTDADRIRDHFTSRDPEEVSDPTERINSQHEAVRHYDDGGQQ